MLRRTLRTLIVGCTAMVVLLGLVDQAQAASPRRTTVPTVTVAGPGGGPTATVGETVTIAATGLDPDRPASLYKGRWIDASYFTGWEYLYYKGYPVAADGTLAVAEAQNEAGSFRYQVCQYYEAARKNYWECSAYVALEVRA